MARAHASKAAENSVAKPTRSKGSAASRWRDLQDFGLLKPFAMQTRARLLISGSAVRIHHSPYPARADDLFVRSPVRSRSGRDLDDEQVGNSGASADLPRLAVLLRLVSEPCLLDAWELEHDEAHGLGERAGREGHPLGLCLSEGVECRVVVGAIAEGKGRETVLAGPPPPCPFPRMFWFAVGRERERADDTACRGGTRRRVQTTR